MKFRTKALIVCSILFLYGSFKLSAQKATTDTNSFPVDSTKFYIFTEQGFSFGNFSNAFPIENKLDGFQNYRERHANTGNAGSPQKQLQLPKTSYETFRSRPGSFDYFGYRSNNRRFFDSEKPYTKIQFILGQKEELNVNVTHAHPFGKNCNVAFGFDRIRSAGFYQRQNTNNTSVNLNGWYRAPGKRYALLADIYWTATNAIENGGIANDEDFEFATQLDRRIVEVNLSGAETRQQLRGAWVKQYWALGAVADTISDKNDSLHYRTRIYPSWAFVHTVGISDEKYIYTDRDPQGGFYTNVLRDTNFTHDSTYTWKVENGLWLERFQMHDKGKIRKLFGKIGVRHESGEIFNDSTIYKAFSNFLLDGNFSFQKSDTGSAGRFIPDVNLKGWFVMNGYNKGDYLFHASIGRGIFQITAEQKRQHPDFIYSHYYGNHFSWINDFYSYTQTDILAKVVTNFGANSFIYIDGGFHNYSKPIYFGENYLPEQLLGSINAISGRAVLSLGSKLLKTKTSFTWNNLPANSPIRLPEFIVRESVYGNFRLFKKALQLQVGVDATWFSAYYGDAYNPNISQFYIQNTKEIGNYVFLDAWLSIKVKPVKIFVKADHFNAGMFGRNYYLVPHNPQNDFALKFGLSWTFND